jgi:glucokinase
MRCTGGDTYSRKKNKGVNAMKEYAFGIDLGGTTAKVGLFTTGGALLEKWEVPTDTSAQGAQILPNLAAAITAKMAEKSLTAAQVEGVGIGVPGPVQDAAVVPIVCANLGGWGQQDVAANLSALLGGIPVKVGNDANVAALGEIWMGAAKGCRSAVMVTLGTGVGGGVIVNGNVIDGAHGAGGEIGHITVHRGETAVCGCGKRGCLEQYSSATGVVRGMKKLLAEAPNEPCALRGTDFAAKDVFDAARNGDALALREVDAMADDLGLALSIVSETADPEMFLLGGGVSRAGDILLDAVSAHFKQYAFPSCRETPIKLANLGNDAGIYGAVRLIVGA